MQFLEGTLQVTQPDEALAVNVPAANMRDFTVERECVRRCFWLVQVMFFINGIYTYRPLRPRTVELVRKVRLPVDENSFELARITSQPGEQICPPRCRRPVPPHFPINEFADATIATRQSSLPSLARFLGAAAQSICTRLRHRTNTRRSSAMSAASCRCIIRCSPRSVSGHGPDASARNPFAMCLDGIYLLPLTLFQREKTARGQRSSRCVGNHSTYVPQAG